MKRHWFKILSASVLLFAAASFFFNLSGCKGTRDQMEDARGVYVQQLADAELAGDAERAAKIREVIAGLDKGLLLVNEDGGINFAEASAWLPPPWNNIALIAGPILGGLLGFGVSKKTAKK